MEQFAAPIFLAGCLAWVGVTYPRLWPLNMFAGLLIVALIWVSHV